MNVSQRKAGVVLSYLSQAVQIITGLVYTPIMLRLLGQSEYGLYQLVFSVVSYLSLLSLGFSSCYMRFYSRFKASKDENEIARLNGMFMTIFLVVSGICILCGAVMIANIRAIFDSGLTEAEYATARILMVLMVFNLAVTFPTSVFDSNVTAHEQFIFQKVVLLLQNLLNPFITLPLLLMGVGSVGMVVVTTLLTLAKLIANMYFCIRKLHIQFIFREFNFALLKEMWVFTFYIFINQVVDQINWSVDKFLLGRMAGTVAVAVYGLGGTLNSMYLNFSTAISNVFVPQVNKMVAEHDDNRELTYLFTRVGRVQFILLSLIISGFIFFGHSFIIFWGGKEYASSYYVGLLLMIPVTVPLIQNLGIEIQRAKNMHKARSIAYLIIAILNVFLSIPLIKLWGEIGAALGTAISLIVGNVIFMNWYYQNRVNLDILYFWREIFKFTPGLLIPIIVGCLEHYFLPIDQKIILLVGIIIYTAVFCLSMWFFGMNEYEKDLLKPYLRKVHILK